MLDICSAMVYKPAIPMIESLRHKGLKELFDTGRSAAVRADLQKRVIVHMKEFKPKRPSARQPSHPGKLMR